MKTFRHLVSCYPLTLICLALIWFLCLMIDMPETPVDDVPFIDKWTHLVMYGGTTAVMWWEYLRCHDRRIFWKLFLFAFLGPILMSGLIEILQENFTTLWRVARLRGQLHWRLPRQPHWPLRVASHRLSRLKCCTAHFLGHDEDTYQPTKGGD